MTERQAKSLTRYFAEGVSASIWCHLPNGGNWQIEIRRERVLSTFFEWDVLRRELVRLCDRIRKNEDLILFDPNDQGRDEHIRFYSAADATRCILEIEKALRYVREHSDEDKWRDAPDPFELARCAGEG